MSGKWLPAHARLLSLLFSTLLSVRRKAHLRPIIYVFCKYYIFGTCLLVLLRLRINSSSLDFIFISFSTDVCQTTDHLHLLCSRHAITHLHALKYRFWLWLHFHCVNYFTALYIPFFIFSLFRLAVRTSYIIAYHPQIMECVCYCARVLVAVWVAVFQ